MFSEQTTYKLLDEMPLGLLGHQTYLFEKFRKERQKSNNSGSYLLDLDSAIRSLDKSMTINMSDRIALKHHVDFLKSNLINAYFVLTYVINKTDNISVNKALLKIRPYW